jgi:uncharacterized protein (DUF486 family)
MDGKPEVAARGMKTVALLVVANVFMTLAWYGHLKFKHAPLAAAIFLSWGIALIEYAFQVPANRLGAERFSVTQLKIMQECITLVVFTFIVFVLFGETPRWNLLVSYFFILCAVVFAFAF